MPLEMTSVASPAQRRSLATGTTGPKVAESSNRRLALGHLPIFAGELRHPAADLADSWPVLLSGSSQR